MSERALRCQTCGEVMPGPHDCAKVRESRALFEAAKRANDPDSRRTLSARALEIAEDAENE